MKIHKKKKNRKDNLRAKQLRRVEVVMRALGVQEEYRRLKPVERDHLLKFLASAPQFVLSNGVAGKHDLHARLVVRELETALNTGIIQIAGTDSRIPLKDYFRVADPLASLFRHPDTHATGRPRFDALAQAFCGVAQLIEDTYENAVLTLFNTINSVLVSHSRIDERLYSFQPPQVSASLPDLWKFHLDYESARIDREEREEGRQMLYRVGAGLEGEVEWLSWMGQQLGLSDAQKVLPVFATKHALRQLHNRISTVIAHGCAELIMFKSLWEPVFATGQGDGALVEYRISSAKLGYFVVDVRDDRVILRTFLFLTMNGTPEGRKLYEKLRLKRRDKEHLDLDKLSTFLQSDIKQDAELVQAFDECGCGHLLTMAPEDFVDPKMADRGEEVRAYLGPRLKRMLTHARSRKNMQ